MSVKNDKGNLKVPADEVLLVRKHGHEGDARPGIIMIALFLVWVNVAIADTGIADRKNILEQEAVSIHRNEKRKVPEISVSATLTDYIKIGLIRNPGLKAAFYEWQSAFNKIAQSFSLPDPQFTLTEYIEEVETRVVPQERALAIQQKFPLPDKLWIRKSKAFKASEVAYYNFEKKRLDLRFQIADAYYEYAYLSKAILLTRENMKLLQNFENVARTKYSAGLQKNQDLLKVQLELGKLENEFYSLKDLRSSLVARLNALLNLPENNNLAWPAEPLEDLRLEDEYKNMNAQNELLSQLALVHYKMRDALRQSHLYKDALMPKALQTLNATYASYAAGGADFLALLDAQRVLLNFQLVYYRHNANFNRRLSELQSLLGAVGPNTPDDF